MTQKTISDFKGLNCFTDKKQDLGAKGKKSMPDLLRTFEQEQKALWLCRQFCKTTETKEKFQLKKLTNNHNLISLYFK